MRFCVVSVTFLKEPTVEKEKEENKNDTKREINEIEKEVKYKQSTKKRDETSRKKSRNAQRNRQTSYKQIVDRQHFGNTRMPLVALVSLCKEESINRKQKGMARTVG
jgi:hypothetical protein